MHMVRIAALIVGLAAGPCMAANAQQIDANRLKSMAEELGYSPKILSEPGEAMKFEVSLASGGYTTPLLLELSPSGRFIWASANLGDEEVDGDLAYELLTLNAEVQPSSFWITESGHLKLGMAIDNRAVTPDYLKFVFEKIAGDVADTADYWEVVDE